MATDPSVIELFKRQGHRTVEQVWLAQHRNQMRLSGPVDAKRTRALPDHLKKYDRHRRFASSYEVAEDGCWVWTKGLNSNGYARLMIDGKLTYAHRFSYEQAKGPIPEGLTIDHVCRNRACVNPEHLDAVTFQENVRRAGPYRKSRSEAA